MHDHQNKIMNKLEDMSELISDLKANLVTSSVNQMAKTTPTWAQVAKKILPRKILSSLQLVPVGPNQMKV